MQRTEWYLSNKYIALEVTIGFIFKISGSIDLEKWITRTTDSKNSYKHGIIQRLNEYKYSCPCRFINVPQFINSSNWRLVTSQLLENLWQEHFCISERSGVQANQRSRRKFSYIGSSKQCQKHMIFHYYDEQ